MEVLAYYAPLGRYSTFGYILVSSIVAVNNGISSGKKSLYAYNLNRKMKMMNLEGKVATLAVSAKQRVTGGSRGIGAATALKLAALGADVAITYGKSKDAADAVSQQIMALGRKSLVMGADAGQPETMNAMVNAVVQHFGKLDILVNNAGVLEATGSIGEINEVQFEHQMSVNIRSVFTTTQAAVKHLQAGERIINISSCLGQRATFAGMSGYNMTKFAVAGLTRSWAHDLAMKNITVNAVLPGPIATDMMSPGADQLPPMKRAGTPEEVANVVAFLASAEASYVTGAMVAVDGGLNA
jgi:3-oxoacyl-[acyl-carrier protein] reductase